MFFPRYVFSMRYKGKRCCWWSFLTLSVSNLVSNVCFVWVKTVMVSVHTISWGYTEAWSCGSLRLLNFQDAVQRDTVVRLSSFIFEKSLSSIPYSEHSFLITLRRINSTHVIMLTSCFLVLRPVKCVLTPPLTTPTVTCLITKTMNQKMQYFVIYIKENRQQWGSIRYMFIKQDDHKAHDHNTL